MTSYSVDLEYIKEDNDMLLILIIYVFSISCISFILFAFLQLLFKKINLYIYILPFWIIGSLILFLKDQFDLLVLYSFISIAALIGILFIKLIKKINNYAEKKADEE